MKNKLITFICIILLFIPTAIAIAVYNPPSQSLLQSSAEIESITVTDSSGKTYNVTSQDEQKTVSTLLSGSEIDALPSGIAEYGKFDITIIGGEEKDVYTVYASVDDLDGIYYTHGDKYYKADTSVSESFLSSSFSSSLYDFEAPVLTVGNSVAISPIEIDWKYRLVNGTYADAQLGVGDKNQNGGEGKGDLNFKFSRTPDTAIIIFSKDGVEYKRTVLDSTFGGIEVDEATSFTVRIEAQWETSSAHSGGSAVYEFEYTVCGKPAFEISSYDVHAGKAVTEQGGIIVLSAKNADVEKLKIEVSPHSFTDGYTPVFYGDGEIKYAFIPTSYETEVSDEYEIKLTYENKTYTYSVNVTERTSGTGKKEYTSKASAVEKYINDESVASLKQLISDISSLSTAPSYIGSSKIVFPGGVSTHRTGYGLLMTFGNVDGLSFNHCGIDVKIKDGGDVTAASDGTVVYVGTDTILGGIIVVDHGLGIRSVYCRISTDIVKVGDAVKQGDVIAKGDGSGFGDSERVHYSVMLGNAFISPLVLIENGFPSAFPLSVE